MVALGYSTAWISWARPYLFPNPASPRPGAGSLRLSDFPGKVVALVFWGTWCAPCMAMVPHEREMVRKLEGRPFVMLGVNCGESREVAKATMTKNGMNWASFWDNEEIPGPIATD